MKKPPSPQFTTEQELLLWAIRIDHTKDQRIAGILTEGVDWNYVRETAGLHGIIPLLYKRLKEEMSDLVPFDELSELRTLFMANAVRNIRMTQQLFNVLDLLTDAGVEAMPFKGPALAVQAYGDLSMRSFSDLDIVIHRYDFDRTYSTLIKSGYVSALNHNQAKYLFKTGIELTFTQPTHNIDVHWAFAHKFMVLNLDSEELLEKSIFIRLNENSIRGLSPEDALLVLCIHGANHRWSNLKWIADIIFLIHNNPAINWKKIQEEACKADAHTILNQSLFLVKALGGLHYPENIETQVRLHLQRNKLNKNILNQLFTQKNNKDRFILFRPGASFKNQALYLFYQIHYIIFTPKSRDYQVIDLPRFLYPFYFIIRPFRLLRDTLL